MIVKKTKNPILSLCAYPVYLFVVLMSIAGAFKEIRIAQGACLVCLIYALFQVKKVFVRKQAPNEMISFKRLYYALFVSMGIAAVFEMVGISFLPVQLFPLGALSLLVFRYWVRHHVGVCVKERIEIPSLRIGGVVEKIDGDQIVLREMTGGVIVLPLITLWKEGYIISSRKTHQKLELKVEVPFSELGELSHVKGLIKEYLSSHHFIDSYYPCVVCIDDIQRDKAIFLIEGKSFVSSNTAFLEKKDEILMGIQRIVRPQNEDKVSLLRGGYSS